MCVLVLALVSSSSAIAQESALSRIAAAKILESKGDVNGAEWQLRLALKKAPESEQFAVTSQLARLLNSQGRSLEMMGKDGRIRTGDATQEPTVDPVDRLIQVLNTGDQTPEVRSAIQQLGMLGDLAVPHLMRAFPDLGPFGVMNALQVFRHSTDARIGEFLGKQIDTAEPEIAMSIIRRIPQLSKSSALPLAFKVAQGDYSEPQKLLALSVLLHHARESATCRALAQSLLASETLDTRLAATVASLEARDMTEAMAIKALKALPTKHWPEVLEAVQQPKWASIGLVALADAIKRGDEHQFGIIGKFEWWRMPNEAAPVLLSSMRYHDGREHPGWTALQKMVSRGWRVPQKLDTEFFSFARRENTMTAMTKFAEALPSDAEDRAIALWESDPKARYGLVEACRKVGKAWPRLSVRHLLSLTNVKQIDSDWLNHDWDAAPKEAVDGLVAFAQKWPRTSPRANYAWADALINAYVNYPSLGTAVVRPLFLSGYGKAWEAVRSHEPKVLLDLAAEAEEWSMSNAQIVATVLSDYGRSTDVGLALRVMQLPCGSPALGQVSRFLGVHGKGSAELVAASALPSRFGVNADFVVKQARQVANTVIIRDLPLLMAAMPTLPASVAHPVAIALGYQVGGRDAETIGQALQACLKRKLTETGPSPAVAIGTKSLLGLLIVLLGETDDAKAFPYLEPITRNEALPENIVGEAARACLQVAGDARRDVLADMLKSSRPIVVSHAVRMAEVGKDAALRELGFAAVLRLATKKAETGHIFGVLSQEHRSSLALTVLNHKDLLKFHGDIVEVSLESLESPKDATYLLQLKKAALHPYGRVRETVARMLGHTFAREAAEPLLELLKDDEDYVRSTAQESLDQIASYLDERKKWAKRFAK